MPPKSSGKKTSHDDIQKIIEKIVAKSLVKNTQEVQDLKKELDELKMSQKSIRAEIYELKTENNQLREINKLQQKRLDQLEKQSQGDQPMVLTEKTDHTLGSLAYLADGYDELRHSTSDMNKMLKKQQAGISSLQDKVDQMGNDLKLTASDLDKLEQYGRRNSLI